MNRPKRYPPKTLGLVSYRFGGRLGKNQCLLTVGTSPGSVINGMMNRSPITIDMVGVSPLIRWEVGDHASLQAGIQSSGDSSSLVFLISHLVSIS